MAQRHTEGLQAANAFSKAFAVHVPQCVSVQCLCVSPCDCCLGSLRRYLKSRLFKREALNRIPAHRPTRERFHAGSTTLHCARHTADRARRVLLRRHRDLRRPRSTHRRAADVDPRVAVSARGSSAHHCGGRRRRVAHPTVGCDSRPRHWRRRSGAHLVLALRALDHSRRAPTRSSSIRTRHGWPRLRSSVESNVSTLGGSSRSASRSLASPPWSEIHGPGRSDVPLVGVALSLSAAACYGLYIPTIGRMQEGIRPAVMSAYVAFGAALVHVTIGLATGTLTARLDPAAWASIAGFALIGTALAFLLFLRGLAVLGPVRTAIVSTIEPFFTTVLGALVLAQPLPPTTLAGGALIAVAVVLLQTERGTRNEETRLGRHLLIDFLVSRSSFFLPIWPEITSRLPGFRSPAFGCFRQHKSRAPTQVHGHRCLRFGQVGDRPRWQGVRRITRPKLREGEKPNDQ